MHAADTQGAQDAVDNMGVEGNDPGPEETANKLQEEGNDTEDVLYRVVVQ